MRHRNLLTQLALQELLLRGHGMRDPMTAVLWGVSRLRRRGTALTAAQQEQFLNHIYTNARLLSAIIESLLLQEELQQRTFVPENREICCSRLLRELTEEHAQSDGKRWNISSSHVHGIADPRVLRRVLCNILLAAIEFSREPTIMTISAEPQGDQVTIAMYVALVVPTDRQNTMFQKIPELVFGPAGLLLSLARDLAAAVGGWVEVEKKHDGNFVPMHRFTDSELAGTSARHVRLLCQFPIGVETVDGCDQGKPKDMAHQT